MASTSSVNKFLENRIAFEGLIPPRTHLLSTEKGRPMWVQDLSRTRSLPKDYGSPRVRFLERRMAVVR